MSSRKSRLLRNAFVVLLVLEICALLWGFLSCQDHIHCIRNMFVALGTHLSSHSFWRFVPSCGSSRCIRNTFAPPLPFQSHSTKSDFGFLMDSLKLNQQVSSTESKSKKTQIHQIHSLVSVIYHLQHSLVTFPLECPAGYLYQGTPWMR